MALGWPNKPQRHPKPVYNLSTFLRPLQSAVTKAKMMMMTAVMPEMPDSCEDPEDTDPELGELLTDGHETIDCDEQS